MGINWDDDETRAELITILAAFQAANQTTQQGSQQSGQNSNQSLSDFLQNQGQTTGSSTVESNVGDIGADEHREQMLIQNTEHVEMNKKLAYDQHLYALMRNGDQSRVHFDQMVVDGLSDARATRTVTIEHLQNAVKVMDLAALQALAHRDITQDRLVNVDEQGYTAKDILGDQSFKDGIKAIVISAIGDALHKDAE